jgi:hypothetical protein
VVATTPGFAENLHRDWREAAHFYGRYGITEEMRRFGVPDLAREDVDDRAVSLRLDRGLTDGSPDMR